MSLVRIQVGKVIGYGLRFIASIPRWEMELRRVMNGSVVRQDLAIEVLPDMLDAVAEICGVSTVAFIPGYEDRFPDITEAIDTGEQNRVS